MGFRLSAKWKRCHWVNRLVAIGVVWGILVWQARHTWSVHHPMYGWPVCFDNLWYLAFHGRSPLILLLDIVVWMLLAGSTLFGLELWRRSGFKTALSSLFLVQAAIAVVLALGLAEWHLRQHPNNNSIFPRYGKRTFLDWDLWFDIGLFTDPLYKWFLIRGSVIFAIGCTAYSGIVRLLRIFRSGVSNPPPLLAPIDEALPREPAFVRVVESTTLIVFALLAFFWIFMPRVR